jgi:hypothetical protein
MNASQFSSPSFRAKRGIPLGLIGEGFLTPQTPFGMTVEVSDSIVTTNQNVGAPTFSFWNRGTGVAA